MPGSPSLLLSLHLWDRILRGNILVILIVVSHPSLCGQDFESCDEVFNHPPTGKRLFLQPRTIQTAKMNLGIFSFVEFSSN